MKSVLWASQDGKGSFWLPPLASILTKTCTLVSSQGFNTWHTYTYCILCQCYPPTSVAFPILCLISWSYFWTEVIDPINACLSGGRSHSLLLFSLEGLKGRESQPNLLPPSPLSPTWACPSQVGSSCAGFYIHRQLTHAFVLLSYPEYFPQHTQLHLFLFPQLSHTGWQHSSESQEFLLFHEAPCFSEIPVICLYTCNSST